MERKFKVLKNHGWFSPGQVLIIKNDIYGETEEGIRLKLSGFLHLPEDLFMEIQPEGKEFDNEFSPDKFRYAGRVGIPKDDEWFAGVASRGYAGAVRVSGEYHHYENILRPILKPISAGTRFNDDWEYAGVVETYHAGRTYVFTEKSKSPFMAGHHTRQGQVGQLLRPIEKSPTKQEMITALEGLIKHWRKDILDVLLDDEELAKSNPDRCPLGQLFYEPNKGKYRCGECPIESGCKYHGVYMAFFRKKIPTNALAVIEHLQKCKDELVGVKMTKCTFTDKGNGLKL